MRLNVGFSDAMTKQDVVAKCEELLDLAKVTQGLLHDEIMDNYTIHVLALKSIGDPYPDDQLLKLTCRLFDIGDKFPHMSVEEIEESMVLCEAIEICGQEKESEH